jgi:hypothetical protein
MKNPRKSTIHDATASYEAWLGKLVTLIPEDLDRKHDAMRSAAFPFLRATYYRWAQLWPHACKDLQDARKVLAVGDLHVENFGTWRDFEGRLIWGINDFDEAAHLPYTNDLVRLATSAHLAAAAGRLPIEAAAVDDAILAGYKDGLEASGRPIVFAEGWDRLHDIATARLKSPGKLWLELEALSKVPAEKVPGGAVKGVLALLDWADHLPPLRFAHRIAGVGSLGRQRFVALTDWRGGRIAREAKSLAPAASVWVHHSGHHGESEGKSLYEPALRGAVRCPDPFVLVKRRWIVRRLAPDCAKIELSDLPQEHDAAELLRAMGWETANVHLGSAGAHAILLDLVSRPEDWLHEASQKMLAMVHADWEDWQAGPGTAPAQIEDEQPAPAQSAPPPPPPVVKVPKPRPRKKAAARAKTTRAT